MGRIFDAIQRSIPDKDMIGSLSPFLPLGMEMGDRISPEIELNSAATLVVPPEPEHRLVALAGQRSLGVEKIRILAAKLTHLQEQRAFKKLLVTSTVKNEGKTVLTVNLAISFARMKQRVLLIDGDFHQASASHILGADHAPGMMDWYRGETPIEVFLRRVEGLSLWFLPAGSLLEHPVEMLQSQKVASMLAKLEAGFDWVCIDSPPSAPLADSAVWAKLADAILLVTRNATTPKRLLKKVVASLNQTKLLGVVLNDCSDPDQQYYDHYYGKSR